MLSAAVLAPLVLLLTWLGGWWFGVLLAAGLAGMAWEWGTMCRWRPVPLIVGLLYLALAIWALWALRQGSYRWPFFVIAAVWCSDVGAYLTGRLVGGPRLAPAISPGKTWSGAAGGLAAAVLGVGVTMGFSSGNIRAAVVLGIAAQLGDLGESAIKRHYKVKDSGVLIPGHGGLLDRLDGLTAAAVAFGSMHWLASMGYDVLG